MEVCGTCTSGHSSVMHFLCPRDTDKCESVLPHIMYLSCVGVDEFAAVTLKYSGERVAQLTCSIGVDLVNEAVVFGTKGKLKLPYPFWCPTKLDTPNVSTCIGRLPYHYYGSFLYISLSSTRTTTAECISAM